MMIIMTTPSTTTTTATTTTTTSSTSTSTSAAARISIPIAVNDSNIFCTDMAMTVCHLLRHLDNVTIPVGVAIAAVVMMIAIIVSPL